MRLRLPGMRPSSNLERRLQCNFWNHWWRGLLCWHHRGSRIVQCENLYRHILHCISQRWQHMFDSLFVCIVCLTDEEVLGGKIYNLLNDINTRATLGVRPSWGFPEKILAIDGKRWNPQKHIHHLTPQWLMEIVATNFTTVAMTPYPSDISDANDISHLIFLTHLIHLTPIWSTTRLGLCPLDPQLVVKWECLQLSQGSFTFVKLKDNNFH